MRPLLVALALTLAPSTALAGGRSCGHGNRRTALDHALRLDHAPRRGFLSRGHLLTGALAVSLIAAGIVVRR